MFVSIVLFGGLIQEVFVTSEKEKGRVHLRQMIETIEGKKVSTDEEVDIINENTSNGYFLFEGNFDGEFEEVNLF